MRIACKVDANQQAVVKALRAAGCTVQDLSKVGKGCPDLLVGYNEVNYLLEVKVDGGRLTERQDAWHSAWMGRVYIVRSPDEAVRIVMP